MDILFKLRTNWTIKFLVVVILLKAHKMTHTPFWKFTAFLQYVLLFFFNYLTKWHIHLFGSLQPFHSMYYCFFILSHATQKPAKQVTSSFKIMWIDFISWQMNAIDIGENTWAPSLGALIISNMPYTASHERYFSSPRPTLTDQGQRSTPGQRR